MTTPTTAPAQALNREVVGGTTGAFGGQVGEEVDAGVQLVEHADAEFGSVHDQALASGLQLPLVVGTGFPCSAGSPRGVRRSGPAPPAAARNSSIISGSSRSRTTVSSLVAKYRKNVAGDTSAAAAISCTVVSAYPWSRNSRSACSWIAARVFGLLALPQPGRLVHRHAPIVATSSGSGAATTVRRGRKATVRTSPRTATAQHVHRVAFIPCTKASRADRRQGRRVGRRRSPPHRRRCRGPRRRPRAAGRSRRAGPGTPS